LIVDDFVDSGKTLCHLDSFIKTNYPLITDYKFATLIYNVAQEFKPDFYAASLDRGVDGSWIHFPWER